MKKKMTKDKGSTDYPAGSVQEEVKQQKHQQDRRKRLMLRKNSYGASGRTAK